MATEKQIQANRNNAKKSTGPRTEQGKSRASQNALKHGLLARDAVLPGEDSADYEAQIAALEADIQPEGALEQELVRQLADAQWRMRRLARIESGYLAACLARLAKRVTSVDIFPDFATAAAPKLAACGIRNVQFQTADALTLTYRAQFDAIAVTGSVPTLDDHFVSMLRPQGRLFIVVGREPAMEARLITLQPDGTTTSESLFETVLAPLINAERPEPFVL